MNTSISFSTSKLITIVIAIAVVVGGGAFYSGMKYAESKNSQRQQRLQELGANVGGFRNRTGGQQGGGSASGEIIAKDDKSVTIKLRDGGSRIIFFSDSTEITKSAAGSLNDLEMGKSITIRGSQNSDGSITAQSIQLSP